MPDKFVFADEAGCFTFEKNGRASRYFILCTVLSDTCDVGAALLTLRRELAWEGEQLGDCFHATEDRQAVRDRVFAAILRHDFSVQATIMEKSKAQPQVRSSRPRFYQYGWYYHFKHGLARRLRSPAAALVTSASLGTKKERSAFSDVVNDVMRQTSRSAQWRTDFMPAAADPCLQVADYCAWAIQRKWERQDDRSYRLIADRISYEFDLWSSGNKHFY